MDAIKKITRLVYRHYIKDSLYRNSILLMCNTAILALFGLVFWLIAAHLYSTRIIGLTTAIISSVSLITLFSLLGFDSALIRFVSKDANYKKRIDSALTLTTVLTILLSLIYVLFVKRITPNLLIIESSIAWVLMFFCYSILNTLNSLTNNPLIAFRITQFILYTNVAFGVLRIILLVLLPHYGLNGIVLSQIIATFLAVILSFYFLKVKVNYTYSPKIELQEIKKMSHYSLGSYIASTVSTIPTLVLPLLVLRVLGVKPAAYYYIVAMIIGLLLIIPQATSQSLLAEGSWDNQNLKIHLFKTLKIAYPLIVIGVMLIIILGMHILGVFGKEYSLQGYELLILLAISSIPRTFSSLSASVFRIKNMIRPMVLITIFDTLVTLIGSLWLLHYAPKLKSIGLIVLISEVLTAILYVIILYNKLYCKSN